MANEKRLIDANALLEEIESVYDDHYNQSSYQFIHDFFRAMLRRIGRCPTVDAVEVVRCKDCIHRQYVDFGDEIGAIGGCGLFGTPMMTCDDFCSYGERREGE